MWLTFALGSAVFAGSAIVLAKAGVKHVNPTAAAALQAIVVLLFAWGMVFFVGSQAGVYSIGRRTLLFLLLSGVSTGLSLFFCFFRFLRVLCFFATLLICAARAKYMYKDRVSARAKNRQPHLRAFSRMVIFSFYSIMVI